MASSIVTSIPVSSQDIESGISTDFLLKGKSPEWEDYASNDAVIDSVALSIHGSIVKGYPDTYHSTSINQHMSRTASEEWYNRIHLIPSATELGNLLTAQIVSIEVWNGFFVPRTLSSITENGTDGIAIEEPAPTPLVFKPLQSHNYTVNIAIVGPPTIDGTYSFNFDVYTVTFSVTGNRVVVFSIVPQADFTESLEWRTDIVKTKATEQRIALRPLPRQTLSYKYQLTERQFSKIKIIMAEWAQRSFSVPMWMDAEYVGALSSGLTSIPIDDSLADYVYGGLGLIFQDEDTFEAVELLDIHSGYINIKTPTNNSYTKAFIMPVLLTRADDGFKFTRTKNGFIEGDVSFTGTSTNDLGFSDKPQWKGKDILLDPSIYVSNIGEKIYREVNKLDHLNGIFVLDATRNQAEHSQILSFHTLTREELWSVRRWLHSKKGKQKTFYVLSWNNDLNLVTDLTTASSTLYVDSVKYSVYYRPMSLAIVKKDGSILLYEVISCVDNNDGTEAVLLSTQVGQDILVSEVEKISFVYHVRADVDRIELKHMTNRETTIVIPIIEVPE